MPETVVLLHGFSATSHAWDGVAAHLDVQRYRPLALDLPGHGRESRLQGAVSFAGCVEHVLERAPATFTLCGYSMGGRVALHVALAAPARVGRLVLISTTAGIDDERERAARRRADRGLADELERIPFEEFIERWRSQPLFADEPPRVDALAREDQRRNTPLPLAAVLRGIGTGEMGPLWDRLGELSTPAVVLAGDRDEKFRALGRRMADGLPRGELVVIEGGHALPLENPLAIARVLEGIEP